MEQVEALCIDVSANLGVYHLQCRELGSPSFKPSTEDGDEAAKIWERLQPLLQTLAIHGFGEVSCTPFFIK